MFAWLWQVFNQYDQQAAKRAARRRQARSAVEAARRERERYFHPNLEGLEERIVPDAYTFGTVVGGVFIPSVGSYTTGTLWTDINTAGVGVVPGEGDVATIPTGAVCTLDNSTDEQSLAGLTVSGDMVIQSTLTVQPGGTNPGGNGTTAVTAGGALDMATPDIPGTTSKLETTILTTAGSGSSLGPSLAINDNATVEVDNSGILSGTTTITGGMFDAKNIDAFTGAVVALSGPGSIGGTGQMEAGINASITFTSGSSWTILPDSAVDSAFKEGNFFVDGPLAVSSDFTPYGDITLDPGGTIGGTGDLDLSQKFTWLGGTLGPDDGTTIEATGDFTTNGAGAKTLASDLTNISAFTDLNGTGMLNLPPGVTYLNAAGTTDVELPSIAGGPSIGGTFDNAANGTLAIKTPAAASTVIFAGFVNDGTLETEGGTLTLSVPSAQTGMLDGTLTLGDDVILEGTFTSPTGFVENAGLGHLKIGDGVYGTGSLAVPSGVTDDVFGLLEVSRIGTLSGAGEIYNNGTVEVDLGGTASLGSYQQGSSGTLKEHASGPGVNSALTVAGNAQLSGILDMEFDGGYMPTSGDTFTVLTAGSISDHFDTTPPDMTTDYTSTSVTVTQD